MASINNIVILGFGENRSGMLNDLYRLMPECDQFDEIKSSTELEKDFGMSWTYINNSSILILGGSHNGLSMVLDENTIDANGSWD